MIADNAPSHHSAHADSHSLKEAEQDHRLKCLRENEHDARSNKSCEPEQQYEPSAVPIRDDPKDRLANREPDDVDGEEVL